LGIISFRFSESARCRAVQDVNSGPGARPAYCVAAQIQRYVGSLDNETITARRVKRILHLVVSPGGDRLACGDWNRSAGVCGSGYENAARADAACHRRYPDPVDIATKSRKPVFLRNPLDLGLH